MTAAAFALEPVAGAEDPQAIGQFRVVLRDVVWTSGIANGTADASVTPAELGLGTILGAHFLGEGGGATETDSPALVTVNISSTGVDISAVQAGGTALDLDSTDVASVRIAFWGLP